LLYKHNNSWN